MNPTRGDDARRALDVVGLGVCAASLAWAGLVTLKLGAIFGQRFTELGEPRLGLTAFCLDSRTWFIWALVPLILVADGIGRRARPHGAHPLCTRLHIAAGGTETTQARGPNP